MKETIGGLIFLFAAFAFGVSVGDNSTINSKPKVVTVVKEEILFPGICESAIRYGLEFDSTHPVERKKYESLANMCWNDLAYQEELVANNPDIVVEDYQATEIELTKEEEKIYFAVEECELDGGSEDYCFDEGYLDYYEE